MSKKALKILNDAVAKFDKSVPKLQREMFSEVEIIIKSLDLDKKGNVKRNVSNLRKIRTIKYKLNRAVLDPEYIQAVRDYKASFNEYTTEIEKYYRETFAGFTKPKSLTQIKSIALEEVSVALTETGIKANIVEPIQTILKENIQSNTSYRDTTQRIKDFMTDNKTGKGALDRYIGTYITDSINTYARTYSQIVVDDLGLEWYRYVGALVVTSRPWCQEMVKKEWIHVSEIPKIIDMFGVPISRTTGLPDGMKAGTNSQNVIVLAGGWNCNHQFIPVPSESVPEHLREKFNDL